MYIYIYIYIYIIFLIYIIFKYVYIYIYIFNLFIYIYITKREIDICIYILLILCGGRSNKYPNTFCDISSIFQWPQGSTTSAQPLKTYICVNTCVYWERYTTEQMWVESNRFVFFYFPHLIFESVSYSDVPSVGLNAESPHKLKYNNKIGSNLDATEVFSFWILLILRMSCFNTFPMFPT